VRKAPRSMYSTIPSPCRRQPIDMSASGNVPRVIAMVHCSTRRLLSNVNHRGRVRADTTDQTCVGKHAEKDRAERRKFCAEARAPAGNYLQLWISFPSSRPKEKGILREVASCVGNGIVNLGRGCAGIESGPSTTCARVFLLTSSPKLRHDRSRK
jgi:hypothetical protein